MPIAKMEKVKVVGLRRQRRQVLDLLQELGLMQVEEIAETPAVLDREINYDTMLSELEFAVSFLEPFEEKKGGFLDGLTAGKASVSYSHVKERVGKIVDKKPVEKCRELENQLLNLEELNKNLLREGATLTPWINLDVPLEELAQSGYVTYFAGMIVPQAKSPMMVGLKGFAAGMEVIKETKSGLYILVAASKDSADEVQQFLVENSFVQMKLPVSHRTAASEIENIKSSLEEAAERRKDLICQAGEQAKGRFDLMMAHDFFLQKRGTQAAEKKASVTSYTFMVEGWIKKKAVAFLQKKLQSFFPESVVTKSTIKEGEEPPIAIENRSLVKPFEAVTGIYGLPSYKEVDPTPLLATFFIVFFGLCLGDAGYGLTLTLVSFVFYKKLSPTSEARKLVKLLIYGGIATFIAGAITGGWFGVEPAAFPEFLKPAREFLLSIRVIDPVKNPIGMLILSLSFGIVQIIFGIFVDFYVKIRDGHYLDAILDDLLWVYFLLALVGLICQKAGAFHITDQMGNLVLGGMVVLVLTQGRKSKNYLMKLGSGILSLYKTVGYLSDVLSYSRLLALGLATSIIGMVINMVAVMTKDMVPVVGYVIMILILIGGHIFNIAVNVLGSFIHSSRLQFVEFFSKFLEGGGVEFQPFKRETKFVELSE